MAETNYANACATVFDPVTANLASTRRVLTQMGFARVAGVARADQIAHALGADACDLLIADLDQGVAEVTDIVSRIRGGDVGDNPFLVIVLTSWDKSPDALKRAIDSGADDVLLRPFSYKGLQDRVVALTRSRKSFIVTGSYIGPDRRKDPTRKSTVKGISAPNTLKAAAEGDAHKLQLVRQGIAAARSDLQSERIRRLCVRIGTSATLRLEKGPNADGDSLEEVLAAATELHRRLEDANVAGANQIATALLGVAEMVCRDGFADESRLRKLHDLAKGALAAFSAGDDGAEMVSEGVSQAA